jgi:hypothetical protein
MRLTPFLALVVALSFGCGGEEPGLSVQQAELRGTTPEQAVLKLEGVAVRPRIPQQIIDRVHYTNPSPIFEDIQPSLPCPMGLSNCGGDCVDLHYDPDHCGACYNACETEVCLMGMCIAPPIP